MPDEPFYLGMQTKLTSTGKNWGPGSLTYYNSPGFVFTRWGDMKPESVRPTTDGTSLLSDHEGKHASVKVLRKWAKGRYTYRLDRGETVTMDDGVHTWAAASVTYHTSKETFSLGSLRFPGRELSSDWRFAGFVEVYGYHVIKPPKELPSFRLAYGNWRINGRPMDPTDIQVSYPEEVPQVAEAKPIKQFVADGECDKSADLPTGVDAVGIVIRSKPMNRRPGSYVNWPVPKR